MSIAKGFLQAAQETIAMGANALQIFLKSPRGGGETKLTTDEAKSFRAYAKSEGIRFLVAHSSYLLNFAKPSDDAEWAFDSMINDLKSIESLDGAGVVLHTGKHGAQSYHEAETHLLKNLTKLLKATENLKAEIILENLTGQGSEMGTTLEQLEKIYKKLGKPSRISFCMDTCHLFGAGYDLSTKKGVETILKEFDQRIGFKKLRLFHFNDSKFACNSKRDRHANLLKGKIGKEGLTTLAHFAHDHEIPMILETPETDGEHAREVRILKKMVDVK